MARSVLATVLGIIVLAGCRESSERVVQQARPKPFRFSLCLEGPADLCRAFAAGRPTDTTGLDLLSSDPEHHRSIRKGTREYVALANKTVHGSRARLILSRNRGPSGLLCTSGELYFVQTDPQGKIEACELLADLDWGTHVQHSARIGWFGSAIHCTSDVVDQRAGSDHAVTSFVYNTKKIRIEADTVLVHWDGVATSDVAILDTLPPIGRPRP
mgnify:CR=1 FL=1